MDNCRLDDRQYQVCYCSSAWAYQVPGVKALDVFGDDIDAGSGLPGPACTVQRSTHDGVVKQCFMCADLCSELNGKTLQTAAWQLTQTSSGPSRTLLQGLLCYSVRCASACTWRGLLPGLRGSFITFPVMSMT